VAVVAHVSQYTIRMAMAEVYRHGPRLDLKHELADKELPSRPGDRRPHRLDDLPHLHRLHQDRSASQSAVARSRPAGDRGGHDWHRRAGFELLHPEISAAH